MECRLCCGGVALRPMQLGCQTSGQCQRSSKARKGQIRQLEVITLQIKLHYCGLSKFFLIRRYNFRNINLFCFFSISLRYEYDDHYFLTDPKEFIYEFYPLQSEWQLLKNPITLAEFEELPFVRSLFFRYQLSFPSDNMKSVMPTDSTGTGIKI